MRQSIIHMERITLCGNIKMLGFCICGSVFVIKKIIFVTALLTLTRQDKTLTEVLS